MAKTEIKTVKYTPGMMIQNTGNLPAGLGAKYLECIQSHIPGVLIAKYWHRKPICENGNVLIEFGN